jgi:hypothetical protein
MLLLCFDGIKLFYFEKHPNMEESADGHSAGAYGNRKFTVFTTAVLWLLSTHSLRLMFSSPIPVAARSKG